MTTAPALTLRPMGESAVLAELPDARSALALYARLRPRPSAPPSLAGVVDVVPAERTVLVTFDAAFVDAAAVGRWLRAARAEGTVPTPVVETDGIVELVVHYDGIDLSETAGILGITVGAMIEAHTSSLWTAAFIGFAPGFAYLRSDDAGVDRLLTLPRRSSPRAVVPAGSVALAAGYCGVYPRESPGGWHLIGRTEAELWEASRPEPALLAPGTRVRFVRAG